LHVVNAVLLCVVIYCRSASERKGVETRQTAAKRGLFHRLHDRLKVTTHDTHSAQKNAAAKVAERCTSV